MARASDSVVVFNEVQYHPANEVTETEWIELRNLHGVDVDIAGWRLEGGITFTFPAGTRIAGGAYIIVAKSPAQIPGAIGPFDGILDNGGEEIRLVNLSDRAMDVLDYTDDGDWPTGADGSGATLSRRNGYGADSGPRAWAASNQVGGTPGAINFPGPNDPPVVTNPITLSTPWEYRDDNVAPPATWKDAGFDDSTWSSGGSLLYAGTPNITGAGEGLTGWWAFQETSGTTAANSATGGTLGTLVGAAATFQNDTTRGRVLRLNYDGVSSNTGASYVSAGSLPVMTLVNNFTWVFWSKTTDAANNDIIVGNRYNASGGDYSPLEFIKFTNTNFEWYRNGAIEPINYGDMSGSPTAPGPWIHHAVVKAGNLLTYYRDGAMAGSVTITAAPTNAHPLYFGGNAPGGAEPWSGFLDDVATWTKALPAASITGLFNGTLTPQTAPTGSTGGTLTTQLALGPSTHYFRRAFNFNGDKSRTTLSLQHMLDDGAVIYLNGAEVLRVNMPGGAVSHNTPASNEITGTGLSSNINIPVTDLVVGTNVIAVEVHQHTSNPDMVFGIALSVTESAGPQTFPGGALVFNEISGTNDQVFRVELANLTGSTINLAGFEIRGSNGGVFPLQGSLAAGQLFDTGATQLPFTPVAGERLFIVNTATQTLMDSRAVTTGLRGRTSSGEWGHPNAATFGTPNTFTTHNEIVINEIMYHPPGNSAEEWVELYNKSGAPVNLAGWHFTDGVNFTFPANAILGAGQYAIVAWDVGGFQSLHPGVPIVYGPLGGGFSGRGERVRLRDAEDNLADEVEYFTGGRWPDFADGGGSSLELRNPNADNSSAEAWAASNVNGSWVNVQYDFSGANLEGNPTYYNELCVGMIAAGEAYIDDLEVIEDPLGVPISLLQNGNFNSGTAAAWRFQGNHRTSVVVDDPDSPGNKVLKIVATGYTEHMSNHCETTLKNGATFWTINAGKTYRIKYRARWAGGSNRLQTRLYFNRGARQELLPMPATGGTPGAQNSRFVANTGPAFTGTTHSPAVPAALQGATVSTRIADSDGVASATLNYSVNGGAFIPIGMTNNSGVWSATIPGQALNAKAQFYIESTDILGATATFPANGAAGRALIPWNDGQAALTLPTGVSPHNVRIVMTNADGTALHAANNVMSNEYRPCTVIYDERDIYYNVGVHLKGSEHGRAKPASRTGFHLAFPPDQLFLGQHGDVGLDRSGAGDEFSQKEILVKRTLNTAGGIPASEDDLCRLIAPGVATGPSILIKAKVDSNEFLDDWLPNGSDGTLFEYELTYPLYNSNGIASSTDNGTVEGNKLTQDSPGPPGVGVRKLNPGTTKEEYRWFWLIKNNRNADDYAPMMTALTALGQPGGAAFITQTNALLDVDGWMRDMAGPVIWSAGDNYAFNSAHNGLFFIKPDGKLLFVPWDMDFTASGGPNAGVFDTNTEMTKLLANAANRRAYAGHLLDICDRAFNTGYLTYWAQHYSKFLNQNLANDFLPFIGQRETAVRNAVTGQFPNVPFAMTPPPASVAANSITLTGTGWVNIHEFRRTDTGAVLPAAWTGNTTWSLPYALVPGLNAISVQAYNFQGVLIGTVTANVTNTLSPAAPKDWLRITELHYHPADPTVSGEISVSTDADDYEFIELQNFASANLEIGGCKFTAGVDFEFPAITLAPGERIHVVRNLNAFRARYGPTPRVAGVYGPNDSLSNSGEPITLVDATGAVIQSFTYDDGLPWATSADGPGYSLVAIAPASPLDRSLASSWRASTTVGGNPNGGDSTTFGGNPNADLDTDGLSAFLEYALGTSDTVTTSGITTLVREPAGTFLFTVTRALNADDVIPTIQASSDLVTWNTAGVLVASSQAGLRVTETWRLTPAVGSTKLFARFKATSR